MANNEENKKSNAVATYKSGLVKTQETFISMISKNAREMALDYTQYQLSCAKNALSKMVELLWKDGLTINNVDQNNITDILQTVAMLQLNLAATPSEGYIILRNQSVGPKENKQKVKVFEFGIEGDGNDKLLRTYGVGVLNVYNHWAVREGDDFTYPQFNGLEITPPTWTPKGYSDKVIRVVYPIAMKDGSVEYHIAEREGVANNLKAHISNNLMWEKEPKKSTILNKIADMTLEAMLADNEVMAEASPAWRGAHSREAMIYRKMRNNAIKKVPKDFQTAFADTQYKKTFEDYDQYETPQYVAPENVLETEFTEHANTEELKIEIINDESVDHTEQEEVEETPTKKKPF